MGSATVGSGDPSMGKSLDEMIQDRRKTQTQESKRGPKKPSAVDRSVASGRAKREAALKERRGLSQTKKATPMAIENEVKRQTQKTAIEKKNKEKKATGGRIAPDSTARNIKKKDKKGKKDPPATAILGIKAPSRKAIEAAIKGMEDAGCKPPAGHQVVISFVPFPTTPRAEPQGNKVGGKKPDFGKGRGGGGPASDKKGNGGRGRGGGGRGRGSGGGRGGGGRK